MLPDGRAFYDGRAAKEENFRERTGVARPAAGGLAATGDAPVANVRYGVGSEPPRSDECHLDHPYGG